MNQSLSNTYKEMNRMPRLCKSGIEYLDYAWNFYSGCENRERGICPVPNCWARGIVNRFKDHYPNGFDPTFYPEAFLSPLHLKKPSRIGVAFMGDLFGDWVDPDKMMNVPMVPGLSHAEPLKGQIFRTINQCPQHQFLFKTKCPQNLLKWEPFPDNCWVGVTATNQETFYEATKSLADIEASVKYISVEPMLGKIFFPVWIGQVLDWLIIGAQTKPYKPPRVEEVEELVEYCYKAVIPVFLKDNLNPLFLKEFPPKLGENFGCWNLPDWVMDKEAKNKGLLKLKQEVPG